MVFQTRGCLSLVLQLHIVARRTGARDVDALAAAKELAKSQIGYFRHALLGGRGEE